MPETDLQQVIWWVIHLLMLVYYIPHAFKTLLPALARIVSSRPFSVLTRKPAGAAISLPQLNNSLGYLLTHERLPLIMNCLAINALGMAFAMAFPSVLYLDMIGTAVAAFLLGPWYGAIVACLSAGLVNFALFPHSDTLPWILVNVTGGLYWGVIAAMPWFRNSGGTAGPHTSWRTVLLGGVVCALVLAFPGTITQLGMGPSFRDSLSTNPDAATLIERLCFKLDTRFDSWLPRLRTGEFAITSRTLAMTFCNAVRYVPDKIVSVVAAIMLIRVLYPMHWNLLVQTRPEHARILLLPRQPVLFAATFLAIPAFHHVLTLNQPASGSLSHSPTFIAVYAMMFGGAVLIWLFAETGQVVSESEASWACLRASIYQQVSSRFNPTMNARFDNAAAFGILAVTLVSFAIVAGVTWLFGRDSFSGASMAQVLRNTSVLVVGVLVLLRLIQEAARQHWALGSLPEFRRVAEQAVGVSTPRVASSPGTGESGDPLIAIISLPPASPQEPLPDIKAEQSAGEHI